MKREENYLTQNELDLLIELNGYIHKNSCRQLDLLNSKELSKLVRKNELSHFSSEDIDILWQLGFLQADILESPEFIQIDDLVFIEENNGTYYYSDIRKLVVPQINFKDVLKNKIKPFVNLQLKPYFHPYRSFALYHINRVLNINIHPMQFIVDEKNYNKIVSREVKFLESWLLKSETNELLYFWNYISFLAALLEPSVHSIVYKKIRLINGVIKDEMEQILRNLFEISENILTKLGRNKLESFRNEICRDAEVLDDNYELHFLIKLMDTQIKEKVTGKIGAAILFKDMVEVYRRHIEKVFRIQISEEDNCASREINIQYKKDSIGNERLLDGDRMVAHQYIRRMGLDYGVKVNVYVEGNTEFYALKYYFGNDSYVNLINLKGAFVESKGKGLAFRESLRNDLKSKIFSVIVLDSDVSNNFRAVKKAVESDEVFGRIFISDPDFEFENFTCNELLKITGTLAKSKQIEFALTDDLKKEVYKLNSGEDFKKSISKYNSQLGQLIKGKEWGEALIKYAFEDGNKEKTIVKVIQMIYDCRKYSYSLSKVRCNIDPFTGKEIKE